MSMISCAAIATMLLPMSPQGTTIKPPLKLPPNTKPLPGVIKPVLPTEAPVLGWADLHAHPASHLAFGAANSGGTTLFHGRPGMAPETNSLAADVPPCKGSHFWDDADIVRSSLRSAVRDGLTAGMPHGQNGYSTFADWPHARSPIHQQMHVTWVYRAYLGGQRLMVASVTDNQTLATIWNQHQFATRPSFKANFDYDSAKAQIAFIEQWVNANSSWMQVVTTPTEARRAIRQNKMAIILGLEMDRLSTSQILDLIQNHRVRQVIPVHLSDNQFGGTAAYSNLFNTNNHFLNGSFIQVEADPNIRFKLSRPQYIRYMEHTEVSDFISGLMATLTLGTIGVGALVPTPVDDAQFAALGYATTVGGHRNRRASNANELKRLFRTGAIIDLAHMSQRAQVDALQIAVDSDYPVMNSHTDLRTGTGESERAMRSSDARKMAQLGGVLGIGTVGENAVAAIANEHPADKQEYFVRLTGASREWTRTVRPTHVAANSYRHARVTVTTGKDDKRDSEGCWAVLLMTDGSRIELPIDDAKGLGGGKTTVRTHNLPRTVRLVDIRRAGGRHHTGSYFKDGLWRDEDNWNVASLKIELLPDPVAAWTREAALTMDAMGGKIAFGTDFNGLENLLPGLPPIQIAYPNDIVSQIAPSMRISGGAATPRLPQPNVGPRLAHFRTDGLAQYGMLPDFIKSISSYPRGREVAQSLFNGAENVIKLWEKSVAARTRVR